MSSLAEEGFLSDETADVVNAVERRYVPWLALFRAVNRRAVTAKYDAKVPRD